MKKKLLIAVLCVASILLTACGSNSIDLNKTKTDKFNALSYKVPSDFKKSSTDKNSDSGSLHFSDYSYDYAKMGSNGKYDDLCSLSFFYDDYGTDYTLERYAAIYHDDTVGTKKTINGVEWYIIKEPFSEKMLEYYYYAKYGNKWYEVSYSDLGSGNICGDALNVIENSLTFGN